jgi:hypothetical protein
MGSSERSKEKEPVPWVHLLSNRRVKSGLIIIEGRLESKLRPTPVMDRFIRRLDNAPMISDVEFGKETLNAMAKYIKDVLSFNFSNPTSSFPIWDDNIELSEQAKILSIRRIFNTLIVQERYEDAVRLQSVTDVPHGEMTTELLDMLDDLKKTPTGSAKSKEIEKKYRTAEEKVRISTELVKEFKENQKED